MVCRSYRTLWSYLFSNSTDVSNYEQSMNHISLKGRDVLQSHPFFAVCVMTNIRLHQLCWGDQEIETVILNAVGRLPLSKSSVEAP